METEKGLIENFDYIVNTTPYEIAKNIFFDLLRNDEKEKMNSLNYTACKTEIVYSEQSFTPYYWINIGDNTIPFGGIIEHTNMIDKKNYDNMNIIYISNYIDRKDKIYSMNEIELFELYYPFLLKINPNFKKENIKKIECYEELYAQPIIRTNYSNSMLEFQLKEKNIFMGTMAQIYPEDRGMNYAIKTGIEIANKIIEK